VFFKKSEAIKITTDGDLLAIRKGAYGMFLVIGITIADLGDILTGVTDDTYFALCKMYPSMVK
jgi:hypothetical protein